MIYKLPEWQKRFFLQNDDGEDWKYKESIAIAQKLYEKWREVYELVMVFTDTLPDTKDPISTQELIYQNASIVAPKLISAAGDTLYIIKMENAAIIRANCKQLMDQVIFSSMTNVAEKHHEVLIRTVMEEFKLLFREWVATFIKDEFEDDWGLF